MHHGNDGCIFQNDLLNLPIDLDSFQLILFIFCLVEKTIDIPYGYVIFDRERERALQTIRAWLEPQRIVSAGRFGSWAYTSMEDSFMEGRQAAVRALCLCRSEAALSRA